MLADDLLQQAYHLASVDAAKPKQANLRRAVSAAYYALFHLLIHDGVTRLSPRTPADLRNKIARAFQHTEMRQVCRSIYAGNPTDTLRELQPEGFSPTPESIAGVFIQLQGARHQADYDLAKTYSRSETVSLVDDAQAAFTGWKTIRARDEATVFLAALLFAGRWSK